jgi:hypothetical protein
VRVVICEAEARQPADQSAGRAADSRAGDGRGQRPRGQDGADAGDGERRESEQQPGRAADGRARPGALRHVLHLLVAVLLDVGHLLALAPRPGRVARQQTHVLVPEAFTQQLVHGIARRRVTVEQTNNCLRHRSHPP